jgi:hypothetical protein
MTKHLRPLLALAAATALTAACAPAALGAEPCPNEQLRAENNSTALPDCRAYEDVSPDSNDAFVVGAGSFANSKSVVTADGDSMLYAANDPPENARSGQPVWNAIRAHRDAARGWSGSSFSFPVVNPLSVYWGFSNVWVSSDLSATFGEGNQPLDPAASPGWHTYVGRSDGTFRLLTPIAAGFKGSLVLAANADFSHVFFHSAVQQLPEDNGNVYSWTEAGGLHLVGILPGGTPAPEAVSLTGGIIGATSTDANRVVFTTGGALYLRIDDEHTLDVAASQRTIEPDPNPGPALAPLDQNNPQNGALAGITADGSKVLFVAHSELTNDAYTGRTGGVATDAGADLYSYDVASGQLTDLTVDTSAVDAATGANVQRVLGASPDGAYIYFTATGQLAPGAVPGRTSLYVLHEGKIDFVADATGIFLTIPFKSEPEFYVTPDGRSAVFVSTGSLTGYDNDDPVTGQPHAEIFLATVGSGLTCVSCRPDGTPPTADTIMSNSEAGVLRSASDDGRRVFFASTDAIVPVAGGLRRVFEYEDGKVFPISRLGTSSPAGLLGASASGDDVFIATYDDPVPGPTAGESAVFDARANGGFPASSHEECSGVACHLPLGAPPVLAAGASSTFSGAGNLGAPAPLSAGRPKPKPETRAQKLARALRACRSKHDKRRRATCERNARRAYRRTK